MERRILYLFVLSSFIQFIGATSYEEDTTITLDQAEALEKFRGLVAKIKLPHSYMEESIFLVRFLRAQNFDVNAAQEQLLQHFEWRKENRIDQLDDEDWSDFQENFPWNLDGVDKEGRPLVQIVIKDSWNATKALENGQGDRLARWVYKFLEDASKLVRSLQKEGKKVTRFSEVADTDGFSPVDHACPACIAVWLKITTAFTQQYPECFDKILVVNAQEPYRDLVRKMWPTLSKDLQKKF